MSRFWLAPHVVACITDTAAVFLDLERDRYRALGARMHVRLGQLIDGWPVSNCADALEPVPHNVTAELLSTGILAPEQRPRRFQQSALPMKPTTCVLSTPTTTVRLRDAWTFSRSCYWARHSLRTRSLLDVAIELSDTKQALEFGATDVRQQVSRFRALRVWSFSAQDRCLFHALALTHFLLRQRIPATWVIGVRTQPWSAHSWVQLDSMLLDATPEQIAPFTVILAI